MDAGMRPHDLYAFVHSAVNDSGTIRNAKPQYFTTAALTAARDYAKLGARKAASQGSEVDLSWPARVPKCDGQVIGVGDHEVATLLDTGRRQTYRLPSDVPAHIYVTTGERFTAGESFLLGVVGAPESVECSDQWDYAADLQAESPLDRYAAVKAARSLGGDTEVARVAAIAANREEDERIRLEALGSLAALDADTWTQSVEDVGAGGWSRPDLAMEAVFILSELQTEQAVRSLSRLAENTQLAGEVRAASVWGLGCGGAGRPELVVPLIGDSDGLVALHAMAAVDVLPAALVPLVQQMLSLDARTAAAATEVLVRHAAANELLDAVRAGGDGALWALSGLGRLSPDEVLPLLGGDQHLADLLAPMWTGNIKNWLHGDGEQQVTLLERQRVHRQGQLTVGASG